MFTLNRCNIPKKLSADCLWSLEEKKKKGSTLKATFLPLKEEVSGDSWKKQKANSPDPYLMLFLRSFCFLALLGVFWVKNFHRQRRRATGSCPPAPGRGSPGTCLDVNPIQGTRSTTAAAAPSTTRQVLWRQLAKRSFEDATHCPKVNSHPQALSQQAVPGDRRGSEERSRSTQTRTQHPQI